MTPRRSAPAILTIVLATITVSPAAGQQRNAISFDADDGWGIGSTNGEYMDDRSGLTADALLAVRVRSTAGGAMVASLNANGFASGPYASICLPAAEGGCIPAFPSFWAFGGLAGWENEKATLRLMGGGATQRIL
jgi:hypothetical protein